MSDEAGNIKDDLARQAAAYPSPVTWLTDQPVGLKQPLGLRLAKKIETLGDLVDEGGADLAAMVANTAAIGRYEAIFKQLTEVEIALREANQRVKNPRAPVSLSGANAADSLIHGIASLAGLGSQIYELDHLYTTFLQHCPKGAREHWSRPQEKESIIGYVKTEAVRAKLKDKDCLAWYAKDRKFRIVYAPPLKLWADEHVLERVASDPSGRVCRYCGIFEDEWTELERIDREVAIGFTRRPNVIREHVHPDCKPYWLELVARASYLLKQEMRIAHGAEGV